MRPAQRNDVGSYDLVHDRTEDGRAYRRLTVIDEAARIALALTVARRPNCEDGLNCLAELFLARSRTWPHCSLPADAGTMNAYPICKSKTEFVVGRRPRARRRERSRASKTGVNPWSPWEEPFADCPGEIW